MSKTLVSTPELIKALTNIHPAEKGGVSISVEYDTYTDSLVLRTSHVICTREDMQGDYKEHLRSKVMKILERLDLLDEYKELLADESGELWSPRI